MTHENDLIIADTINEAVKALNGLIESANRQGLRVELSKIHVEVLGHADRAQLQVSIYRPILDREVAP